MAVEESTRLAEAHTTVTGRVNHHDWVSHQGFCPNTTQRETIHLKTPEGALRWPKNPLDDSRPTQLFFLRLKSTAHSSSPLLLSSLSSDSPLLYLLGLSSPLLLFSSPLLLLSSLSPSSSPMALIIFSGRRKRLCKASFNGLHQ